MAYLFFLDFISDDTRSKSKKTENPRCNVDCLRWDYIVITAVKTFLGNGLGLQEITTRSWKILS